MTLKNILTLLGAVLSICLFAYSLLFMASGVRDAHATGPSATVISVATTSAVFSITTSARILATTTNTVGSGFTRVYASICNNNANPVALNLNGDKVANASIGAATTLIASAAGYNACYEITDRNLYSGSVTASSTSQASTQIFVEEFVQ